jgi:hypothetical protein
MSGRQLNHSGIAKIKFIRTEFKDTFGYFKVGESTIASLEQRFEAGRPVLYLTIAASYIINNDNDLQNNILFMRMMTEKCQQSIDSKSQMLITE